MPLARLQHPHNHFTHHLDGVADLTNDPTPVTAEQGARLQDLGREYGVVVIVDPDPAPVEVVVVEPPAPEPATPGPEHDADLAAQLEAAVEHAQTTDATAEPAVAEEEHDQSDNPAPTTPEG